VPSWQAEPARVEGSWLGYRQTAPDTAPLFHAAGEHFPSQQTGRWHRQGDGYAQYMALEPPGAWSELIRYERIRHGARAAQYVRRLWLIYVAETDIADLSTFSAYEACGLDPRLAVAEHEPCQILADDLRHAGYRGILSPNAALAGTTNLTLFGDRYEKVLRGSLDQWQNPQPGVRLPCLLVAEAGPPADLVTETCCVGMQHDGYREHLRTNGLTEPTAPP
jgi:RES domain